MPDVNWDLVKFKFEVLGIPLETLAVELQLSLPVLQFNSQSWKQIPLASKKPLDLEDLTSLEDILTKLGSETSSQTKAFAILKQKFLGPKYVELETVLLHKAISIAQEIRLDDPKAASTLNSLTAILGSLLMHNPLLKPGNDGNDGNDKREWKITFVDAKEKDEKL